MKHWRWPQWVMILSLLFQIGMSFHMQVDNGKIGLEGIAIVFAWVGSQAFIMWRGGFWK